MVRRNPQSPFEKFEKIQWGYQHLYAAIAVLTIVAFFMFPDEKMISPKWATIGAFSLLFFIAMGESWEAWKRKGAIIITSLGKGKGGATGFNPDGDIRIAKSHDNVPNFAVIATGGFNYWSFSCQGSDDFIVCPPEHIMQFYGNYLVKTRLRRVWYDQLPRHVQNELMQLPKFKKTQTDIKRNLWFGMTSDYYGTDTDDNLRLEEKVLSKMDLSNEYSHIIEDIIDQREKTKPSRSGFDVVELKENESL